jgi:hypothetical protein
VVTSRGERQAFSQSDPATWSDAQIDEYLATGAVPAGADRAIVVGGELEAAR